MSQYPTLEFFGYEHLPAHLQAVSRPFAVLAEDVARIETAAYAEVATALRKLLEAKDCAVRAAVAAGRGK